VTLPFRRRHHDDEAGHDRARTLMSDGLLVTLPPEDAAWLGRHLDGCTDCGRDWKAFRADHRQLRALRDQPLEPPRDLWARTSAALDREARRRGVAGSSRSARGQRRGAGWRALPLGAAAGAIVIAAVIGTRSITDIPPSSTAAASAFAFVPTPDPTGLLVPDAEPVAIFRETATGSWELVYRDVKELCPPSRRHCVPKPDGAAQPIDVGEAPSQMELKDDQLVYASEPNEADPGRVLVVEVNGPDATPTPTVIVTQPPSTPTSPPPTGESPGPPTATPGPTPPGAIAIATGVRVIGDVAYSGDGRWLAFSAQPADDSTGPDLYLWKVGDPEATVVTTDHQTYFASWRAGQVLASRVEIAGDPNEPGGPDEPGASAGPDESARPGRGSGGAGNQGGGKPRASDPPATAPAATAGVPEASREPDGSAAPSTVEGHPISFLLDPETLDRTDLSRPDVWLPVLDRSGRFVVYWSGTLQSDDGLTWALGTGELVLDRWSGGQDGPAPAESPEASAGASADPGEQPVIGPVGLRTILVPGDKVTFEASFDPSGSRLAIWVGEALDEKVGRLHLLVVDPASGAVGETSPLDRELALRRFSIDKGRLAWVTPSGQDGQESSVQVLGWRGDDFGEIETDPATDLYLP
jgi:hypothetical protein